MCAIFNMHSMFGENHFVIIMILLLRQHTFSNCSFYIRPKVPFKMTQLQTQCCIVQMVRKEVWMLQCLWVNNFPELKIRIHFSNWSESVKCFRWFMLLNDETHEYATDGTDGPVPVGKFHITSVLCCIFSTETPAEMQWVKMSLVELLLSLTQSVIVVGTHSCRLQTVSC